MSIHHIDGVCDILDKQPGFWVVNKKSGIDFHADQGTPGLINHLNHAFPAESFLPVHRLDKDTSGLLLVARSPEAAQQLSTLFAEQQIRKFYLALSDKKPKKKQGWVIGDMAKSRNGNWKLLQSKKNPSRGYFQSTAYMPDNLPEDISVKTGYINKSTPRRLFVWKPFTGKTHQLRVAMKSLGVPILGDRRYGGASADRLYLHASCLQFSFDNCRYTYHCKPDAGEWFLMMEEAVNYRFVESPELLDWPD